MATGVSVWRSRAATTVPMPPAPIWPTKTMLGFARKRGLDPEEVTDLVRARVGEPEADADLNVWGQAFYAMCNGMIGGFEDSVCSGIDELHARLAGDEETEEPISAQLLCFAENLNADATYVVTWATANSVDLDWVLNALHVRHGWPEPLERERDVWVGRFNALCQDEWSEANPDKVSPDPTLGRP